MNQYEILAMIGGGIVGYWAVLKLLTRGHFVKPSEKQRQENDQATEFEGFKNTRPPENAASTSGAAPWWEVLQVDPRASTDEIRSAYKRLISEYHPDKVASLGTELRDLAEAKSKEINRAYRESVGPAT